MVQLIPAMHSGGAERGTLDLAKALVQQNHQSTVISSGGRMVEMLEHDGVRHIQLDIKSKSLSAFTRISQLKAQLLKLKPDIVHARSRLPAWMAWLAIRKMPARPAFVTTLHGFNSISFYSSVMLKADRVIAVSRAVYDFWQRHYPDFEVSKTQIIQRGTKLSDYPRNYHPGKAWEQQFRAKYQCDGKLLLTLPGRISAIKGQQQFIELIEKLIQSGHLCHGLIVGDGHAERTKALAEIIQQKGLQHQISLCGHRDDLRDILAISDWIFSLTTKPEAFGRTVAESLTLGRPVVAFDHGGVSEMMETAFPQGRVKPNSAQDLFDTTVGLLNSNPIVNDFKPASVELMTADTLTLYQSLLRNTAKT